MEKKLFYWSLEILRLCAFLSSSDKFQKSVELAQLSFGHWMASMKFGSLILSISSTVEMIKKEMAFTLLHGFQVACFCFKTGLGNTLLTISARFSAVVIITLMEFICIFLSCSLFNPMSFF